MTPDFYSRVFIESAWVASILPLAAEQTLYAMKAFGGFDLDKAFVLALIGSTLGQLFNWGLGRGLLKMKERGMFNVSDYWYSRIGNLYIKYGVFTLFFCWAPLCNFLVVAAAFLGVRARIALPLMLLGIIYKYVTAIY